MAITARTYMIGRNIVWILASGIVLPVIRVFVIVTVIIYAIESKSTASI